MDILSKPAKLYLKVIILTAVEFAKFNQIKEELWNVLVTLI